MIVGDAIGASGELVAERATVGVGDQGIVAWWCREHTFGQPAHPEAIELDTEREGGRPDEHAFTEASDPIPGSIQFEPQRSPEHFERRGRVDVVESAEAVDGSLDAASGLLLERRPAGAPVFASDPASDEPVDPCRQRVPGGRRIGEIGGEFRDEALQFACPFPSALHRVRGVVVCVCGRQARG